MSSGNDGRVASSGNDGQVALSGRVASSGSDGRVALSNQVVSDGDDERIALSGQVMSYEDDGQIASSGRVTSSSRGKSSVQVESPGVNFKCVPASLNKGVTVIWSDGPSDGPLVCNIFSISQKMNDCAILLKPKVIT